MLRALFVFSSFQAVLLICASATADDLPRTITVSGQGKISSAPDMATINCGVSSLASTAKESLAENNRSMQQVMTVLKGKNIAAQDIQTSGFNVYPEYIRDPSPRGTTKANRISGYRVSNNVRVKVRELSRLGEILDALVQGGSNQISGVQFGIANMDEATNLARQKAVADARARAGLYAEATGTKVGKVIAISEQAIQTPQPMAHARAAMAYGGSVPVSSGEQEVSASVNIMYELAELTSGRKRRASSRFCLYPSTVVEFQGR